MKFLLGTLFLMFGLVAIAFAQKADVTGDYFFVGEGVSMIGELPLPTYPAAARKAGIGGQVRVPILVGANGKVTVTGNPIGPHPVCPSARDPKVDALREEAVDAARKAKFSNPAGQPVEGAITYLFPREKVAQKLVAARVVGKEEKEHPSDGQSTGATLDGAKIVGTDTKVPGGVLNGKATSLPRPPYPPAARAVRASGTVDVQVLIGVDGTMFSAEAISGHPLLRSAAETAACSSRFMPTLLSGKPVKVVGVIKYNFVP